MDRWVEVYIPKMDLYVLGVYVPDNQGMEKNLFWKKILEYARENFNKKVMITGDFDRYTKEDSSNESENNKDLMKLEELGYIDLWKYNATEESMGYTWFHPIRKWVQIRLCICFPQACYHPRGCVSIFRFSDQKI